MVNQTPISIRINDSVLEQLSKFCSVTGAKRNRVINRAIHDYLELIEYLSECEEDGVTPMIDPKVREWVANVARTRGSWWWWRV